MTTRAALCLALTLLAPSAIAGVHHVDDDAPPGGDGTSWATAFSSLDEAIAVLALDDQIWLAEGTYVPAVEQAPGDPRSVTFLLPAGVRLYGAFAGFESSVADRVGSAADTILDGELGAPGHQDNAYHVLTVLHPDGVPPGSNRVNGLTVRRGNADAPADAVGGGIKAFNVALRLEGVRVEDCEAFNGAGVHAQPGLLAMDCCELVGNRAANNGGGLWGQAIALRIQHVRFADNEAVGKGGGVYVHSSLPYDESMLFSGCVFHDNAADVGGGAFVGGGALSYGVANFRNCTFAYNTAVTRGGALRANTAPALPARVELRNSIAWANDAPEDAGLSGRPLVSHCDLQDGGWGGTAGCFEADPLFVDGPGRDLRLAAGSPCVDAGDDSEIARDLFDLDGDGSNQDPLPFDVDGLRREVDDPAAADTGVGDAPLVDLGAYERAP